MNKLNVNEIEITPEMEERIIEEDEQITQNMDDYQVYEAMNLMNELRIEGVVVLAK